MIFGADSRKFTPSKVSGYTVSTESSPVGTSSEPLDSTKDLPEVPEVTLRRRTATEARDRIIGILPDV